MRFGGDLKYHCVYAHFLTGKPHCGTRAQLGIASCVVSGNYHFLIIKAKRIISNGVKESAGLCLDG